MCNVFQDSEMFLGEMWSLFGLSLFWMSSSDFGSCSSSSPEFPKYISIMSSIASSVSTKFSCSSRLISGFGCKSSRTSLLGKGTENFLEMLWRTQQAVTMRVMGLRWSTSTVPRLCKHRKRVFKQPMTFWVDFQTWEWAVLKRLAALVLIWEISTGLSTCLSLHRPLPPVDVRIRNGSKMQPLFYLDISGIACLKLSGLKP